MGSKSLILLLIVAVILMVENEAFSSIGTRGLLKFRKPFHSLQTIDSSRKLFTALKFKVSETDEEEDIDETELDFDDFKPSSRMKKLSNSIIPLAATLGFAVTPSSGVAIRLAGAAAGGVAGLVTKIAIIDKMVRAEEKRNADDGEDDDSGSGGGSFISTEVSTALRRLRDGPPLKSYTLQKLESVARKLNLPANLLAELFTHVFAEAVVQSVQTPSMDVTELGEMIDLAEALTLTSSEINDGLTVAAVRLGRMLKKDKQGFFTREYPKDFLLHTAKLFFLSNKMMGTLQGYYGRRFATALSFFPDEALKEVITDACTKLFVRCVDSVLKSPGDFSQDEIEKFREFLTVSDAVSSLRPASMQNIIMDALTQSVDLSLGPDAATRSMVVNMENYADLQKAREVFGWNPIEFDATVETKTMPIFEAAARELVEDTVANQEKASQLSSVLLERISALNIDVRKARVYLTELVSKKNGEYMTMIDRVYNVSGTSVEPAFKIMAAYSATHEALSTLTKDIMDGIAIPLPGLPFAEMVRVSMFEMQLAKKDSRINDEMFALNEDQKNIVLKNLVLPKVSSWIKQCISENNFSPDAKVAYEKLLRDKDISQIDWQATAIDFYYQEVSQIAKTRAIPSSIDMQRIADLKVFLGCSSELTAKVNLELLGDKYVKAVSESMTPTGVISEEYLDGLNRLRDRLGISSPDAERLLGLTSRKRLGDVVKSLREQWKADTGAIQRKDDKDKKDKSRDPISSPDNVLGYMETGANVMETGGPNVFMREALNLVDFFVENYLTQDIDVTSATSLPVTAVGYAPESDLVDMYKHYLITRLTEQDVDLKNRYEKDEKMFAMILGIMPESQMKVKESLLYSSYKRMLKNVLSYKDAVDAQDLQQFAFLKESLFMEKETADRILLEASKGAVIEHCVGFMRPKEGFITADMARRLRSQVISLGLDFRKDAGFNDMVISYLFTLEVQAAVESANEGDLQEIQEAYDIPQDRAAAIIEATCKRYVSQLLNIALAASKKYLEDDTNRVTMEIAKFMFFFDGPVDADGNLFIEEDKERLVVFFRDREGSTLSAEDKKEVTIRLRSMINLTQDFIAPLEGIAGLKGEAKTDRTSTGMMM